jgi:Ice-binding-like
MSSDWMMVVRDARDAKTVSSEISIEHQSASDVNDNDPDAWAYFRDLSTYFGAGAVGATSLKAMVVDGAVAATGSISLVNFITNDTFSIGGQLFGNPGVAVNNHLLTAQTYGVLGDSAVTNVGSTVVTGDLGNEDAASITGFFAVDGGPGTVTGTINSGNAAAIQAVTDATAAYTYYSGLTFSDITGTDLGGHTFTPGNYSYTAASTWTAGNVTFNAQGNPAAVFVIKTATTLVSPASVNVVLTNGASASNIYWIVGSAATLGASNLFQGTIIAQTTISVGASTNVTGRLLDITAAVTIAGTSLISVPVAPVIPSIPAANQFAIGGTDTITAANAAAMINANPLFACVLSATSNGVNLLLTSLIPGLSGNLIPLAISRDNSFSGMSGGTQAGCADVEEGVE